MTKWQQRVAPSAAIDPGCFSNDSLTLRLLHTFLLALAAALFLGSGAELLLVGHFETPFQRIPFVLCGPGLLALAVVWARPNHRTGLPLRAAMVIVMVGALVGVAQHFSGNLELARETRPSADAPRLLVAALTHGSPLFAPAVLIVAAAVAVAATYSAGTPGDLQYWRPSIRPRVRPRHGEVR